VLVSITILAFITIGAYQIQTYIFGLRNIVKSQGEFYTNIRMAMEIMEKDIALIYSPVIMMPPEPVKDGEVPEGDKKKKSAAIPLPDSVTAFFGRESDFWRAALDDTGIRPSRLIGESDKITFISASHNRIYKEKKESIFAKISYYLLDDKFSIDQDSGEERKDAKVLVKVENTDVFEIEDADAEEKDRIYPLLHGVTKFEFSYYTKGDLQPVTRWNSGSRDHKSTYPDYIEVEIEVESGERLKFSGKFKFRWEIPLNGLDTTV